MSFRVREVGSRLGGVLALALLLALQVLALASRRFPAQLTSDDLYPYVFCQNLLHGGAPLSGWSLSSAPYFFPDFAGFALLLAATGWHGGAFAAYAVASALALGLAGGALLRALDPAAPGPWRRGLGAANAVVALGWLPGMGRTLWWELAPGFHGGVLLVAVAAAALVAGGMNHPSRPRWLALVGLLWLGLLSDAFLALEAMAPLAAAIAWAAPEGQPAAPRLRRFGSAAAAAGALFLLVRLAQAWGQVFFAASVFRSAPSLEGFLATAGRLGRDLGGERVAATAMVAAALGGLAAAGLRSARREAGDRQVVRFVAAWSLTAAGSIVGAILVLGYWHDATNARYLYPLYVFPAIAGAALAPIFLRGRTIAFRTSLRAAAIAILVALGIASAANIRPGRLVFSYPADVASLDGFCRRRGLERGLCDFWTLHRVNVLGRAGLRLSPLRGTTGLGGPAASASFWNDNAYAFLDRDPASGRWARPRYTFIVVNGLDEASLRARYGEPRERVQAGAWRIWILADPEKASALVVDDVRGRLRGRRWDAIAGDLR